MELFIYGIGLTIGLALTAGALVLGRRWWRWRQSVCFEDALKQIFSAGQEGRSLTRAELAGRLGLSTHTVVRLTRELENADLLRSHGEMLQLTAAGERLGLRVLRGHRLLERYLADEAGMPLKRLHGTAEQAEHLLSADEVDALADHLGHPRTDPHGDLIPSAAGKVPLEERLALTDWPSGPNAVVAHIEDEPRGVLSRVLKAGLRPGTLLRIAARDAQSIVCETAEGTLVLSPTDAAYVHVRAVKPDEQFVKPALTLAGLPLGATAEIAGLSEHCTGLGRRRLLDLGFTPGTSVQAVLANPHDSAHAYRIRDTMIALRHEQAEHVLIQPRAEADTVSAEAKG